MIPIEEWKAVGSDISDALAETAGIIVCSSMEKITLDAPMKKPFQLVTIR